MLDALHPYGSQARPYLSRLLAFQVASEPWQLSAYRALRTRVFCHEQQLFPDAEAEWDAHDASALPIIAMAHSAGTPDAVVGVVRIYENEAGVYWGGRLAVDHAYRRHMAVGAGLIRKAVCTAHYLGCQRFLATVQAQNARYFERHHFAPLSELLVCGAPHVLMQADLSAFPMEAPSHASLAA